ncbi:MAG: CinA family protein [Promethearchaeota archaeon]
MIKKPNYLVRIRKIIDNYSLNSIKISVAESCTGGFISHMITNVSGASKIFDRGIVWEHQKFLIVELFAIVMKQKLNY